MVPGSRCEARVPGSVSEVLQHAPDDGTGTATVGAVPTPAFAERLAAAAQARRSVLCVGLDPRAELVPDELRRGTRAGPAGTARAVERFCEEIVDATAAHAVAVKPQSAFFEALGHHGVAALERLCQRARDHGLLVVLDAKRGDIGSTAEAYAAAYLGGGSGGAPALADALTVNPYLGLDSLAPFVQACDGRGLGLFVLVRTSNPGAADLQEQVLASGGPVWELVARMVASLGVGAVMGATAPAALTRARELMPLAPFLLPGVGAQGGDADALAPAFAAGVGGGLVSVSRAVMYAPGADWRAAAAAAAAELRERTWLMASEQGHG